MILEPNATLNYRYAQPMDIQELQELGRLSYAEYEQVLEAENWSRLLTSVASEETYANLLKQSVCYVAEYMGRIVGMIYYTPSSVYNELYGTGHCSIRFLGIHPDHRGKGLAKNLIQLCLDRARADGETSMALHTSEFMNAARSMYEKIGFERNTEFERFGKKYWVFYKTL